MNDSRNQCDSCCNAHSRNNGLSYLNKIAKRPAINIEFTDLVYSVRDGRVKGGWRQLLKSINGKFLSGEFTAIMGPSGAGKSTLLNILAGYVTAGLRGSIKTNDIPRNLKLFNKLSSYIMQDNIIQPRLTVREIMMFSATLKLGRKIGDEDKKGVVEEVLELLGLQNCLETKTEFLSGGQRKRLAVALELVNNPPVIFLDEPTSGLDNYAIKQCIDLLQKISKQGRTVICTIHQPPSSLFQIFDQVYVLSNGFCVYNGSPAKLVPFLSSVGIPCPENYTPADYVIEVVHAASDQTSILQNAIQNGKVNLRNEDTSVRQHQVCEGICEIYKSTTENMDSDVDFPLTFASQTKVILSRMLLQMRRNKTMLYIQFFHHLISSFLVGGIYIGTGNDATQVIAVFKYLISVGVFFMYTYVMAPVLLFPLEIQLLKMEYFNRWYSLKAYYTALTISTLPLLLIFSFMFVVVVYFTTDQPADVGKFTYFCIIGILIALCSQGLGYAIGSIFTSAGSVAAPSILAVILAFAVYGMGYQESIEPLMEMFMMTSYLRFGLVAFCLTLFLDRENLYCPNDEMFCLYSNPKQLLVDMGMVNSNYRNQLIGIITFMIIFRLIGYLALKYRMNSELKNKVMYYATKIIRQKE